MALEVALGILYAIGIMVGISFFITVIPRIFEDGFNAIVFLLIIAFVVYVANV